MKRGIVYSPSIYKHNDGSIYIPSVYPTPEQLRFFLLYWDKIDFPDPDGRLAYVMPGSIPELDLLQEAKLFHRTKIVNLNSHFDDPINNFLDATIRTQSIVASQRQDEPDCYWSLCQEYKELKISHHNSDVVNSLQFRLSKLLPAISANVPMSEVLEFKHKPCNQAMIDDFWGTLDFLAEYIDSSSSIKLAESKAVKELTMAVSDLRKTFIQRFTDSIKMTDIGFNRTNPDLYSVLERSSKGVIGGLAGNQAFGIDGCTLPLVGLAYSAASSFCTLKFGESRKLHGLSSTDFNLGYLSSINTTFKNKTLRNAQSLF